MVFIRNRRYRLRCSLCDGAAKMANHRSECIQLQLAGTAMFFFGATIFCSPTNACSCSERIHQQPRYLLLQEGRLHVIPRDIPFATVGYHARTPNRRGSSREVEGTQTLFKFREIRGTPRWNERSFTCNLVQCPQRPQAGFATRRISSGPGPIPSQCRSVRSGEIL